VTVDQAISKKLPGLLFWPTLYIANTTVPC